MKKITLLALLALPFFGAAQPEAQLKQFFKLAEQNGYAGSALVAQNGAVLLQEGFGWQDPDARKRETAETVFSVGSITKQFTAAAICQLVMQHKLSYDDPLSKFFPEAPAKKAGITIHQLLTHTAGFPDAIGDDYELISAAGFMERAFRSALQSPPGEEHHYSNVGYSILGIIIEKISGKGYEQFCYENLWKPAGMEHTGYLRPGFKTTELAVGYRNGNRWGTALDHPWTGDGPGWHLRANGGVLSTVSDMYRWFQALQGTILFDADTKARMFSPHAKECPDCPTSYGYGWVIDETPDGKRLLWHNGGNGVYNAYMGFVPADGTCIIVSSNTNGKVSDDFAQKVMGILNGAPSPAPALRDRFSGNYTSPTGSVVRVHIDEFDHLVMEWEDAAALQLLSGDGSETPENTKSYVEKSVTLANDARAGRTDGMAKAMDMPPAAAKEGAADFWDMQQKALGPIQQVEGIGAVLRPGRNACLVFMRIVGERKSRYLIHVWSGDHIMDVRVSENMDKVFDYEEGAAFFAPNNRMRVMLKDNGEVELADKNGVKTVLRQ